MTPRGRFGRGRRKSRGTVVGRLIHSPVSPAHRAQPLRSCGPEIDVPPPALESDSWLTNRPGTLRPRRPAVPPSRGLFAPSQSSWRRSPWDRRRPVLGSCTWFRRLAQSQSPRHPEAGDRVVARRVLRDLLRTRDLDAFTQQVPARSPAKASRTWPNPPTGKPNARPYSHSGSSVASRTTRCSPAALRDDDPIVRSLAEGRSGPSGFAPTLPRTIGRWNRCGT